MGLLNPGEDSQINGFDGAQQGKYTDRADDNNLKFGEYVDDYRGGDDKSKYDFPNSYQPDKKNNNWDTEKQKGDEKYKGNYDNEYGNYQKQNGNKYREGGPKESETPKDTKGKDYRDDKEEYGRKLDDYNKKDDFNKKYQGDALMKKVKAETDQEMKEVKARTNIDQIMELMIATEIIKKVMREKAENTITSGNSEEIKAIQDAWMKILLVILGITEVVRTLKVQLISILKFH
eukprot:CAMPEP_0176416980 /NCGR_PEP_ID=MMETSP0127-20121128/6637_1 /TAXON_ID=938130 /ORGANISM="Platyophrya macrostoma, Strain WH" /LENGTH=232 /DNA_ID=CAMNT_0017797095 /DNA_START=145 /DNA_END=844 /DNA_ORIENTATION=+